MPPKYSSLRKLTKRKVNRTLYHYTSQEGFLGILNTNEIWATNAQYLNDTKEMNYAISLVNDRIYKNNSIEKHKLNGLKEAINDLPGVNICVCSFTEKGDLLSQWRGYGSNGSGMSLGFSGSYLNNLSKNNGFLISPCIYKKVEQNIVIDEIIYSWINNNLFALDDNDLKMWEFIEYFSIKSLFLKDISFSEEREWRIVSPFIRIDHDRYDFRVGKYTLIPYYKIPISKIKERGGLIDIYVGPSSEQKMSERAAFDVLLKYGYDSTKVKLSDIPFRNW